LLNAADVEMQTPENIVGDIIMLQTAVQRAWQQQHASIVVAAAEQRQQLAVIYSLRLIASFIL